MQAFVPIVWTFDRSIDRTGVRADDYRAFLVYQCCVLVELRAEPGAELFYTELVFRLVFEGPVNGFI